jgi:hypothetical protein
MALDAETIDQQRALLATHRRTLAHLLQQAARYGGEVFAPPQTANGIEEARAAIARIKAALREAGAVVEDEPGDVAAASEETRAGAPPTGVLGRVDVSGQVTGNVVGTNYGSVTYQGGDQVAGDKFTGDKVLGDKYEIHNHPQPHPAIDPDQAQALLDALPLDTIPDPARSLEARACR